jgi:hypothetical protein
MSVMRRLRFAVSAAVLGVVAAPLAYAQAPAPGDSCTVLHATTQDVNGRPMWCNATMTGDHSLVWQYGGPGE